MHNLPKQHTISFIFILNSKQTLQIFFFAKQRQLFSCGRFRIAVHLYIQLTSAIVLNRPRGKSCACLHMTTVYRYHRLPTSNLMKGSKIVRSFALLLRILFHAAAPICKTQNICMHTSASINCVYIHWIFDPVSLWTEFAFTQSVVHLRVYF